MAAMPSSDGPTLALETSEASVVDKVTSSSDKVAISSLKAGEILGVSTATAIVSFLILSHVDTSIAQSTAAAAAALNHLSANLLSQVWGSYEAVLAESPIATKAATSATVYSIGDLIAQNTEGSGKIDLGRVVRSGLAGGIGHGPMSHFWYDASENFFSNTLHLTQWWSFIPKIAVDQTVWGTIWNTSYIMLLGLMKSDSLGKMVGDVKSTTLPLFLDGLKLWPLVHCVTYGLIPVEHRLLWVDLVEIVWVSMLASKAASLTAESEESAKGMSSSAVI